MTQQRPPDRMSAARQAARSNLLLLPLSAAAGFAATIVLARVLSISEFALFAIALAIRGTAQYFSDLGTGAAAARVFAELGSQDAGPAAVHLFRRLAAWRLAFVVVVAAAAAAFPESLAGLLDLDADQHYFIAYAVAALALEMLATLGYYTLTALYAQPAVNRVQVVTGVVQPALIALAAVVDLGLPGILVAMLLGSLGRATALNVVAWRRLRALGATSPMTVVSSREYLSVAGASTAGKAAAWVHSRQFLTLLAAGTRSRAQLAAFALAHDFVQQVMAVVNSATSGLAIPTFAGAGGNRAEVARLFRLTTRGSALLALGPAAAIFAVLPSFIPVVFGEKYTGAADYGQIVAVTLAVETILSAPATALMLADSGLLRAFGLIKFTTLAAAAAYLVIGADLIVLVAVMAGVRASSAVALHAVIRIRRGISVEAGWLTAAVGVAVTAAGAGALFGSIAPGREVDLLVVPAVVLLVHLAGVRALALLRAGDAALAGGIFPPARRLLEWVAR